MNIHSDSKMQVHYQSLYIHLNIQICFEKGMSASKITAFILQCYNAYNLDKHSLADCNNVYIKIHMPRTLKNSKCTAKQLANLLVGIQHSIFTLLPKLIECTFELSNTKFGLSFLQLFIDNAQNAEREVMNTYMVALDNITFRLSLPWMLIKQCQMAVPNSKLHFFSRVDIDCMLDIDKNLTKGVAILKKIVHCSPALAHISINWNLDSMQRDKYWEYIIEILLDYGFTDYQTWHFSKDTKQSIYLRNIYALQSYLGLNIGKVPAAAISWAEGDNNNCAQLGKADSIRKTPIIWGQIASEEELEFRIMQAEDSEYLVIPTYLRKKLVQNLHKETINDIVKESVLGRQDITTEQGKDTILEDMLLSRGYVMLPTKNLVSTILSVSEYACALSSKGEVYVHKSKL